MIELNKIYNEDCLEGMKRIPDGSVDMILCDLPYGTTKLEWDVIIPFDKLWQQYWRILKDKGIICLTGTEPFTSQLIMSNPDRELFKEKLTWIKHRPANFANAKYRHLKYTEDIAVFGQKGSTYNRQMVPRKSNRVRQAQKGNTLNSRTVRKQNEVSFGTEYEGRPWSVYNADFKNPTDYIEIPAVGSTSKEKVNHQTQKPVKLFEYLIKTYSNMGETVLDNCIGSGTTAIAAINTKRNFIGFELNKEYFEIAQNRIEERQSQISLFDEASE